jgi:hypothetical protein
MFLGHMYSKDILSLGEFTGENRRTTCDNRVQYVSVCSCWHSRWFSLGNYAHIYSAYLLLEQVQISRLRFTDEEIRCPNCSCLEIVQSMVLPFTNFESFNTRPTRAWRSPGGRHLKYNNVWPYRGHFQLHRWSRPLPIRSAKELPTIVDSNCELQRLSFQLLESEERCKSYKTSNWNFSFCLNDHIKLPLLVRY